jgi:AmmeMemoRadiSam system protein B
MKLRTAGIYALIIVLLLLAGTLVFSAGGPVKEPAVAGSFYPADKRVLSGMVQTFMEKAETAPVEGRLIALIAPHAGYEYSGQIAAYSYKHLKDRAIDTIILIGPSHHDPFAGASVYAKGGMKTPLGTVRIEEKIAAELINEKAQVTFYPGAFEKEHSLEVQLPFLQTALRDFTIVPILIGQPTRASFEQLSQGLTAVLRKHKNAIIIASTDLSHYHDYQTAKGMDTKVIDAVSRMSVEDAATAVIRRGRDVRRLSRDPDHDGGPAARRHTRRAVPLSELGGCHERPDQGRRIRCHGIVQRASFGRGEGGAARAREEDDRCLHTDRQDSRLYRRRPAAHRERRNLRHDQQAPYAQGMHRQYPAGHAALPIGHQ